VARGGDPYRSPATESHSGVDLAFVTAQRSRKAAPTVAADPAVLGNVRSPSCASSWPEQCSYSQPSVRVWQWRHRQQPPPTAAVHSAVLPDRSTRSSETAVPGPPPFIPLSPYRCGLLGLLCCSRVDGACVSPWIPRIKGARQGDKSANPVLGVMRESLAIAEANRALQPRPTGDMQRAHGWLSKVTPRRWHPHVSQDLRSRHEPRQPHMPH
jgi:hypothetical protein